MLTRRAFTLAAGLCAALALAGTASAQEKVKIRIGTHVSISAHLFMQKKPDILKNYGKTYEVEWVRFAGSGDAMPALVAGKIDGCLATPFPMANAINQSRVPVVIVHQLLSFGFDGHYDDATVIRTDSGIKTVADLKGKTFGVNAIGGTLDMGVRIMARKAGPRAIDSRAPSPARTATAIGILIVLVFSKYFYMASITSYYTFYLIHKFGVSTQSAQLYLFLFLGAVGAGTFFGGPIGDRIGRRYVIWASILGALPFTLLLPHAGLTGSAVLSVIIGFIIASAMPAIIVYAQELMPHRFGMISGLFFGFAFGAAGIGAAIFGEIADRMGIDFVYAICAYLPAIGLLAVFLPNLRRVAR